MPHLVWKQSGSILEASWQQVGSKMAARWQQDGSKMAARWQQDDSKVIAKGRQRRYILGYMYLILCSERSTSRQL